MTGTTHVHAFHFHRRRTALAFSGLVGIACLLPSPAAHRPFVHSTARIASAIGAYASEAKQFAEAAVSGSVAKCLVDGVTTYSDSGCPQGTTIGELTLQAAPAVTSTPVAVPASSDLRQARCDAAHAELRNIDALTVKGQPADMQAFLDARRSAKKNELFLHRC